MIELGEIVPAGPLTEGNKPNRGLGGTGDADDAQVLEVTNGGKEPRATDLNPDVGKGRGCSWK